MANTVNIHQKESDGKFVLRRAILLYENFAQNTRSVYATLHPVERRRGGTVLGAGEPATVEACAEFARALADRAAFSGFVDPCILFVDPHVMAWWRAPGSARVWFQATDSQPEKNLGDRTAIVPHPGLVFVLAHGNWFVYAVAGADRPDPQTPLYRTHYFNVWLNGRICEGNIERPERVTPETISRFERAFFDSRFTHPNIHRGRQLTRFTGGPYAFWRALLDGRWKNFPMQHLVPLKVTLAEQLRKLEENRHDDR